MTKPDDTDTLSAWLDGELPPAERAAVEARLRDDPQAAATVRDWHSDARSMRAALDPVLDEPVPPALAQTVWRRGGGAGRRSAWRWAAAVALFVLGGAVGAGLATRFAPAAPLAAARPAPAEGFVHRAAVAHSVYAPEVRHPVEVRAQEEHLARWLTRRLDVPVKLFDLRAEGFELVGGRLLPDANGPSAQLMYQALDGDTPKPARVTVYLRKAEESVPAAFRYEQQGALGTFYWVEGKAGYALVGDLPRERLLALAQAIHRQEQPAR